jgi:spore coat polysaccharide biosynthesis protein SpsF (cytidylyltransferase family)
MKIVAIVQARCGSLRLPGKVLAGVEGRPLLGWVLARAAAIPGVHQTVLATTTQPADAALVEVAREMGMDVCAGSESDVLDRYVHAARQAGADAVVRITADCPLIDPQASRRVIERFLQGDVDYVSNQHPRSVPDGLDTEICSMDALEAAWRDAGDPGEREHVTPYIWNQTAKFRVAGVGENALLASLRLTVDYAEDLALVRAIYARFTPSERTSAGLGRIVEIFGREPELLTLHPRAGWTLEDVLASRGLVTA